MPLKPSKRVCSLRKPWCVWCVYFIVSAYWSCHTSSIKYGEGLGVSVTIILASLFFQDKNRCVYFDSLFSAMCLAKEWYSFLWNSIKGYFQSFWGIMRGECSIIISFENLCAQCVVWHDTFLFQTLSKMKEQRWHMISCWLSAVFETWSSEFKKKIVICAADSRVR